MNQREIKRRLRTLKIVRKEQAWWVVSPIFEVDIGPYKVKQEAVEDRDGLRSFCAAHPEVLDPGYGRPKKKLPDLKQRHGKKITKTKTDKQSRSGNYRR